MVNWWLVLVVWMPRDFLISKRDYYLGVPIAFQTTNPNHQFTFVEDVMVQLFQDLSDATLNWSKSRQLGSGSYGAVFKGEMKVQSIHWIDWEHWDVCWSLCQHVFPWCNGKGLQWYSGYAFRTWRHVQKSRHQKAVNFSWCSDSDGFFQCWIQNFREDSFTMDFLTSMDQWSWQDGTQVAIKMIDLGALKSSGQPLGEVFSATFSMELAVGSSQVKFQAVIRTEDMAGFDQEVATLSKCGAW